MKRNVIPFYQVFGVGFLLLISCLYAFSQEKPEALDYTKIKGSCSAGVVFGSPWILGDVNAKLFSTGYGLHLEKTLNHAAGIRLQGSIGTTKGVDKKFASKNMIINNLALNGLMDTRVDFYADGLYDPVVCNYKMDYKILNLEFLYHFNSSSDYRQSAFPRWKTYLLFGVGSLFFKTFTDQLDHDGELYDYSSVLEEYQLGKDQKEVKRKASKLLDGNYETPAEGNPEGAVRSYQSSFLKHVFAGGVSVGGGLRFKLSELVDVTLETKAFFTKNDLLDGQRWSKLSEGISSDNDILLQNQIGVNIRLGKAKGIYYFDNPAAVHYEMSRVNSYNTKQLVSDSDNDGVSDYYDRQPATPEGVKVDAHGIPVDSDMDGVPDYLDMERFSDIDAIVDSFGVSIDSDSDGVPDHKDLDNHTPAGRMVGINGMEWHGKTSQDIFPVIFFDFNSTTIKEAQSEALLMVANIMKQDPQIKMKITGYADPNGSPAYNEKLAMSRAMNVAYYLVALGIDRSRLEVESKGEREPLVSNVSKLNHLNRRAQFEIVD